MYVVGPLFGGAPDTGEPVQPPPSRPEVIATAAPPEPENWVMPSPPQVEIYVEPVQGDDDRYEFGSEGRPVPPPMNISSEGDVDEAGLGGFVRRPKKDDDEAGIGGISWPPVNGDDS